MRNKRNPKLYFLTYFRLDLDFSNIGDPGIDIIREPFSSLDGTTMILQAKYLLRGRSRLYLIEGPDCRESKRRLRARAEKLKNGDCRNQFSARRSLQVDDGVGSLVYDHLRLVAQAVKKNIYFMLIF